MASLIEIMGSQLIFEKLRLRRIKLGDFFSKTFSLNFFKKSKKNIFKVM